MTIDVPDRDEWNDPDDGERFHRLAHDLDRDRWVDDVEFFPGGAIDSARIELRQYTGTVPKSVTSSIYDAGLAIRSVGGYMSVDVSPPERRGGDLDDDEEVDRP